MGRALRRIQSALVLVCGSQRFLKESRSR